jgi:hypothetical protein
MFIIGSGVFAVYALGYGIKGLVGNNNDVKQEIAIIETPKNKSKIIDVEYIEL